MRRVFLLCLTVALAACTTPTTAPTTTSSPSPPPTSTGPPPAPDLALPILPARFGGVPDIPLLIDEPPYAGPETPHSLDGVRLSDSARMFLDDETVATIERQGFAVIAGDARLFHQVYAALDYTSGDIVYVTTDGVLHSWHLAFDKVLRSMEQDVLLPKLESLARTLAANATAQRTALKGTPWAAAATRVDRLLQTELVLLGLASPRESVVTGEIARIESHDQMVDSPILGKGFDYTMFTPRGHYTRNEELTRYFLGMSVLGLSPFAVAGGPAQDLRGAVLVSRVLVPQGLGSGELVETWRAIYEPTAFLVGTADDYTPRELTEALASVAPEGMKDPASLSDADLRAMREALLATRTVQINPEEASVRLMGARFVLDSWILDQLVYPLVGTPEDPRLMPSTLDVASVFGSDFARRVQKETGQHRFENYHPQASRLREALAERPVRSWGSTVYDGWLWTIQPLWTPHGLAYPDMMRTRAWAAKDTMTGAGSYAELKHDTILYAKQFGAEGANGLPPDLPRNWVEPEPVVFERLVATATLLRTGLDERALLTGESRDILDGLIAEAEFLARVARDELAGQPLSEDDNARLDGIGGWLEWIWFMTADQAAGGASSMDQDAAIVADVGRGGDEILEIATGRIDHLLILVPDDDGDFQLAHGAVYSFYEFAQPLSERLDDETWRAMLDRGEVPDRPTWQDVLFP